MDLLRVLVLPRAVPVPDREVHGRDEYGYADECGDAEDREEEVVDLLGRRTLRVERVLTVVVAGGMSAPTEHDGQESGDDEDEPASPRAAWRHVPFQ